MRAVLVSLLLLPLAALASPRRVAVLELRNPAGLEDQEVAYLAGLVRGEALRLPAARYLVMTRENLLELLPPGVSLEACVGDCEVETGRNIGADLVLSGEVVRFGGELRLVLRLHETREGRLLAHALARAPTVLALEEPVAEAAREALAGVERPRAALPPVPRSEPPVQQVAAGPPTVQRIAAPRFGYSGVDVDALELYDRAVRLDRSHAQPEEKADAWRDVAHGAPAWRALAEERARAWEAHARGLRAAQEARAQRAEARDRDWRRLSRLLRLQVVPAADKRRWAEAFLDTYGYDRADNPFVEELVRHAFGRDARPAATTPVRRALGRAVGRVVRVVTADRQLTGLLRGYNDERALLDVDGRLVDVVVADIRRVAVLPGR